jgi:hypothetical protein
MVGGEQRNKAAFRDIYAKNVIRHSAMTTDSGGNITIQVLF